MPDFAVSTAFRARDKQINAAFKRMSKNARLFGKTTASAFDRASRSGKRFKGITSGILKAGAIQRGLGLLSRGVGEVVNQFVGFDDAITGAAARFKDIGPGAEDFNDKLLLLKKRARDAGATTEFTAKQAAESLDFLARAGFTSTEAMKGLGTMIDLATASGEDFAQVADFSSDLLGAFGLASKNTAQKMKNLTRLNDVLVKSANSANVTIESQFETMKVAAPIFAIFGDNLEQVAALTSAMGNAGIKGSQGATALKNAILRLAAPTPKVSAGMAKLGLNLEDIQTIGKDGKRNLLPMTTILKTMGPLLKKLGTKDKAEVLDAIFGKRSIAATANLIKMIDSVEDFEKVLKNSGGTAKKTAELMRKSLGNRLKTLQSAAIELGFKFLEAFKGDGVDAITALTKSIREFNIRPLIDAMKSAFSIIKAVFFVVKPFLPLIIKVTAAVKLWSIAQRVFNAVMTANPIGIIIVSVISLIDKINLLIKKFIIIKKAFSQGKLFSAETAKSLFAADLNLTENKATPPNAAETKSRQEVNVFGTIGVTGPEGTTVKKDKKTSPGISMEFLGANP